jgi:hypothetical protein
MVHSSIPLFFTWFVVRNLNTTQYMFCSKKFRSFTVAGSKEECYIWTVAMNHCELQLVPTKPSQAKLFPNAGSGISWGTSSAGKVD